MKHLLSLALALSATQASAATILSAEVDTTHGTLVIQTVTRGGCGEHKFSLEVGACQETFPVQCTAELIEETNDTCEALLPRTVIINLHDAGLTSSYYQGATITILGDMSWQTRKRSSATVQLP